jgi:hypothetical protein
MIDSLSYSVMLAKAGIQESTTETQSRRGRTRRVLLALCSLCLCGEFFVGTAAADVSQESGYLAPPSNGSFRLPIIQELGLDKKYRIDAAKAARAQAV